MTAEKVQVTAMWQASCDDCGWHTAPSTPQDAVREWARLHRVTCPLKTPANASRHACDECGSRVGVVFIPDPECGGVHAWYTCAACREPAQSGRVDS